MDLVANSGELNPRGQKCGRYGKTNRQQNEGERASKKIKKTMRPRINPSASAISRKNVTSHRNVVSRERCKLTLTLSLFVFPLSISF